MFAIALAFVMSVSAARAAAPPMSVSLFGSYVNEDTYGEESEFGDLQPLAAWTILDSRINKRAHLVVVFAVKDRDKAVRVHDCRFHWKPKQKTRWLAPWLSEIAGGYFIPPFGREWSTLNPFQVGPVRYAGMADSLVARDAGARLDFVPIGSVAGTFGFFFGDRTGGYAGEAGNTHRHAYFQVRRPLFHGVVAGASYRWTTRDRNPWAVELTRESERGLYAFELLRVERLSQWYALAERDIRHRTPEQGGGIRLMARFEELRYGERLALGCAFFPDQGLTFKVNYVHDSFPESGNHKLLLQGIAHHGFSL